MNEGCSAQDRLTPQGRLSAVSVVNDRPLCVVTAVTEGLLWGARGSQRPCIHLAQQLEEQEFSTQEIMQSKQDSYDYFITFISSGLSSFRRKLVQRANSPTKQPVFTLCCPSQSLTHKSALFWRHFLAGFPVFPALPLSHFCPSPSLEEGVTRLKSNQLN